MKEWQTVLGTLANAEKDTISSSTEYLQRKAQSGYWNLHVMHFLNRISGLHLQIHPCIEKKFSYLVISSLAYALLLRGFVVLPVQRRIVCPYAWAIHIIWFGQCDVSMKCTSIFLNIHLSFSVISIIRFHHRSMKEKTHSERSSLSPLN